MEPETANWLDYLKASCALPVMYRNALQINGEALMDGGVVDSIPVKEAYRRGARRIVVIRSQIADYVKKKGVETKIVSFIFRKNANFVKAVKKRAQRYMEAVSFINNSPRDAQIIQLAPERPLYTSRTSQDLDALNADYQLGLKQGQMLVGQF